MSWFFCVFFTLLTTLPCILHAGTTVRMKFARGRCIKNDTNQTYYHYPSQFQQNNPVRNPNGLFLLTVDKIGGALIYPIRLQGKKPFIMIYNLTKKQLSENVYSHCMFVPNAPTAECQWAYLNGTSINKPFIQYQTIDPLTAERYTATEDDKCYSSGSSRRSEQCMRWFRTKNNAKNATKTTSIKTQYTIFTQNVKFNKESLPGHWLIQPLPNSYRYKVKKVQESPSITKINQEVQYANELNADSAMAQGRLKRRFLKQMLALPVLQAFRGVSSVHNFVRLIKRIMLRVNVIPDWMVHGLNRFTGLLSRWFTMGPIDTSFSYLDAMQNNSYITQFAFSYASLQV